MPRDPVELQQRERRDSLDDDVERDAAGKEKVSDDPAGGTGCRSNPRGGPEPGAGPELGGK